MRMASKIVETRVCRGSSTNLNPGVESGRRYMCILVEVETLQQRGPVNRWRAVPSMTNACLSKSRHINKESV